MKIRLTNRHDLADAAGWISKSLPTRPSVPVLAGILLTATTDGLGLSGFDYEVSTHVTLPVEPGGEDGTALVSARLLAEIAKSLPNKPVELAAIGTHLELVCGSARFTLPTMPAEDFPALPDMPARTGTIDAATFAATVEQAAVAAGKDEALPMMTGVRVEINGPNLSLLATDRYRLAVRDIQWNPDETSMQANALIPASTLKDAAKQLGAGGGEVVISLATPAQGEGVIGFASGGRRMTSRLLDGANYPPVRSLFPPEFAARAVVNVAELEQVVKRVALVAERTTPVLLSFSADGLIVEAGGSEDARASEAMGIASYTGEPLTAGFNPTYLLDGLHHLGTPTAHIGFVDAIKPAVISPADTDGQPNPDHRYLIMPIRVSR